MSTIIENGKVRYNFPSALPMLFTYPNIMNGWDYFDGDEAVVHELPPKFEHGSLYLQMYEKLTNERNLLRSRKPKEEDYTIKGIKRKVYSPRERRAIRKIREIIDKILHLKQSR